MIRNPSNGPRREGFTLSSTSDSWIYTMQKQRSISDRRFARERKRFPCEWTGSGRGGVCRRWDAYDPPMDARHTLRLRRADPCAHPIAGCPSRDVELANSMAPASKEENIKHPKSRRRENYMLTLPAPSAMCPFFLRPVSFRQTKNVLGHSSPRPRTPHPYLSATQFPPHAHSHAELESTKSPETRALELAAEKAGVQAKDVQAGRKERQEEEEKSKTAKKGDKEKK